RLGGRSVGFDRERSCGERDGADLLAQGADLLVRPSLLRSPLHPRPHLHPRAQPLADAAGRAPGAAASSGAPVGEAMLEGAICHAQAQRLGPLRRALERRGGPLARRGATGAAALRGPQRRLLPCLAAAHAAALLAGDHHRAGRLLAAAHASGHGQLQHVL
ncbi:unnamed protein product, partial [Durusdinium trenchii]